MWVTGIRCVVTGVTFRGWMTTVTWTFLADANFLNSDTAWFWTEYLSSILHRVGGRGGGGEEEEGWEGRDGRGREMGGEEGEWEREEGRKEERKEGEEEGRGERKGRGAEGEGNR